MPDPQTPVKVLDITGVGHSGSTILDMVLGSHPDVQSTGELTNLLLTGWVGGYSLSRVERKKLRRPICTCGQRLDIPEVENPDEACLVQASVRREWVHCMDAQDDIESYPTLQRQFERLRCLPHLLRERRSPSLRFQSYSRLTRALFEAISATSEKPVIVGSS